MGIDVFDALWHVHLVLELLGALHLPVRQPEVVCESHGVRLA